MTAKKILNYQHSSSKDVTFISQHSTRVSCSRLRWISTSNCWLRPSLCGCIKNMNIIVPSPEYLSFPKCIVDIETVTELVVLPAAITSKINQPVFVHPAGKFVPRCGRLTFKICDFFPPVGSGFCSQIDIIQPIAVSFIIKSPKNVQLPIDAGPTAA